MNGSATFDELARSNSDDSSSKRGGDVGSFPRHGKMQEPFAKASFELEIGAISEIVETNSGFHIIKRLE